MKKGRESEYKYNSEEKELEVQEEETSEEFIRLGDVNTDSSSTLGTDGSDTWHRQLGNWKHWQQALGIGQLGKLAHDWRLDGHWTSLRTFLN